MAALPASRRPPIVDAATLIAALEIVAPARAGERWRAVCPVCLIRAGGAPAHRRTGGKCERCPYDGLATVVALLVE